MEEKSDIQICLGSSCFSRGNKKIVKIVQDYILEHDLSGKVNFHGGHCFSKCENGPTMLANGKFYHHLTEDSVANVLNELFGN
ncbi:MAG: (2Fe-2S) ferredoxin domain-containing protein [Chloroflexota bacterium]